MKLLHTADWHLGKRLNDRLRIPEQKAVLEELCEIVEKENVDVVLIAGDLYDTYVPSNQAMELFYKTLHRLANYGKRAVVAIAGNHDSADRIEAPDPLALECGIILAGYPNTEIREFSLPTGLTVIQSEPGFVEIKTPGVEHPLRILLTPYANEARIRKFLGTENPDEELRQTLQRNWQTLADTYCDDKGVNVLLSHLFMMKKGGEKMDEPRDERHILHLGGAQAIFSENIPPEIQYTALGHLHRQHKVNGHAGTVAYSGSILEYSFAEAEQQKYVLIVDIEPGEAAKVERIPLHSGRQLVRKRFENPEAAILWLQENPDTYVEVTLVTDEFIDAAIRKSMHKAHDGIMAIIPELTHLPENDPANQIDLKKDITSLFKDYFRYEKNQAPNEELLEIFKEVRGEGN